MCCVHFADKSHQSVIAMSNTTHTTLCMCCKTIYITQHNFQCGHVVADANGGSTNVNNLRPICTLCNQSMGVTNMKDFALTNFNVVIN